jgi:TolB protein
MAKIMTRIFLLFGLLFPFMAHAALDIEIVGGAAQQIPIAVPPFTAQKDDVSQIIADDLRRSGLFRILETGGVAHLPRDVTEVKYSEWTALQAQALVIGKVEPAAGGLVTVSFRLLDVLKQTQMIGASYPVKHNQLRRVAHKIADEIYRKFTGEAGMFDSRISYVLKTGNRYALMLADSDGYAPQEILSYTEPIISPSWSPDGSKLAYVSFEKKKPIIFVQDIATRQRIVLANYKGNNSAPAWSPDGKKLAIVLTQGANSQISIINADGTGLQPLSRSQSIDTEPQWSPDGKWIYFSSNRGGSPQIYRMSPLGGEPQRVTFEGSYNVSPRLSFDGKQLAFIRRDGAKFQIAVQELANGQVQVFSDSVQDESPSFAPNGRLIIYATKVNNKGVLSVVSSDGRVKQRLREVAGDVREPAWGSLRTD